MANQRRDPRLALVVVAALSLPGGAARAAVPPSARELGGIRLGMTMEEVKAAAAAHQPPLILEKPILAPTPGQSEKTFPVSLHIRSYTKQQPADFEELDLIFSPPPVPRVFRITQFIGRSEARAPSKERLQKELRDKFGGPPAPGYPGWVWSASGTPTRGEEAENCLIGQGTWLGRYQNQPQSALANIKDTSKNCGLIAVASFRDLQRVLLTVTDYAALADALAKSVQPTRETQAAASASPAR